MYRNHILLNHCITVLILPRYLANFGEGLEMIGGKLLRLGFLLPRVALRNHKACLRWYFCWEWTFRQPGRVCTRRMSASVVRCVQGKQTFTHDWTISPVDVKPLETPSIETIPASHAVDYRLTENSVPNVPLRLWLEHQ